MERNSSSTAFDRETQRSYPLSALFVLVAGCAVVSALLTPVVRAATQGDLGAMETAASSVGGGLLVMIVGGVIGLYHYRALRGLGWGLLTGGVVGLLVGPVVLTPSESFGTLVTMSVGGTVVLLVTGFAFGLRGRSA